MRGDGLEAPLTGAADGTAGTGGGRKARDTLQFWAPAAERCSLMAGETRGRTSFGGEKKRSNAI